MKDVTTGTDTREPRPMHRGLLTFDLVVEAEALRAEPAWAEYGRAAKTLAHTPTFRVVLTALRAGGSIGEEEAHAPMTVQVVTGAARADRDGAQSIELPNGGLAWFDGGPGWRVTALVDAVLLLAISWPAERSTEPASI